LTGETSFGDGAFGHSAEEWEQRLTRSLERGDHAAMREVLLAMRAEMRGEVGELGRFGRAPLLDRLAEHARRLLRSDPTELEALEEELARERKAWVNFRRRYRATFVPEDLHPFLRSCGVFIGPDETGVQFNGFDKYAGQTEGVRREAITLFVRSGDPPEDEEGYVPPNFFSFYDEPHRQFEVRRAYRTVLPRGAGTECVHEHVTRLVPQVSELERFGYDDVQNRPTFNAFVGETEGVMRLRASPPIESTPLGRVAMRVLASLDLEPVDTLPTLDRYGTLDLDFSVRPI
jgi:hypothetical protein